MKLSDLQGGTAAENSEAWALPYPRSSLADPPITADEARAADTTICRWHKGEFTHLSVEGRVYLCAIGRQYFRFTKNPANAGMYKPLNYGWHA